MTGIVITGAAGRMGGALIRCAAAFKDLRVVGATEQDGNQAVGRDAGAVAGIGEIGVKIGETFETAPRGSVVIDFTAHAATAANARLASELGIAMVIGTTGLTDAEGEAVKRAAKKIPIVWAPNMGLGMNVLFALVRKAAETLGMRYDVEIVETHHRHKKDAPSGTALRLAGEVAAARKQDLKAVAAYGRNGQTGERPVGQIAIHALRMGDIVGDHTVSFAVDGERIELSHRATSRDAFAVGALRAAMWVAGRKPGLYDMHDVLGL